MITHVVGDLLASTEKHIAHGCNTEGKMGAGIALHIANAYPQVWKSYKFRCDKKTFVLGSALPVYVGRHHYQGDGPPGWTCSERTVWNLGTQRQPGPNATYWGIVLSFGNMFEMCAAWGVQRVGIPRIGCGIGSLRWQIVENLIIRAYEHQPDGPEIVVYTHPSEVDKSW